MHFRLDFYAPHNDFILCTRQQHYCSFRLPAFRLSSAIIIIYAATDCYFTPYYRAGIWGCLIQSIFRSFTILIDHFSSISTSYVDRFFVSQPDFRYLIVELSLLRATSRRSRRDALRLAEPPRFQLRCAQGAPFDYIITYLYLLLPLLRPHLFISTLLLMIIFPSSGSRRHFCWVS